MTRYIAVRFREGDKRTYTYHYEGAETFAPGDEVQVPDRAGDGWQRVIVASVDEPKPRFATKGIIGRAPAEVAAIGAVAPVERTTLPEAVIGHGALVEGFRWRTQQGERIAPADMRTGHLFYTLRMIWNNHVAPEKRVGKVALYSFGPTYTPAYFEDAITNLAREVVRRDDLAAWQRRELERMAEHSKRPAPQQLDLIGGG